jgi:2'-5' RNA ligase
MDNKTLYDSIYQDNITYIRNGNILVDEYLATGAKDLRRGLSLIIPLSQITESYEAMVEGFRILAPEQYYYPTSNLHITVFDYIAARDAFARSTSIEQTYIRVTDDIVKSLASFAIVFKGIVFSREAGLLKGYDDGSVTALRERIRKRLKDDGLPNMERYQSMSVHSTFMRFTKKIDNAQSFSSELELRREVELGIETVKRIVLVEHDWYNRKNLNRTIKEYELA